MGQHIQVGLVAVASCDDYLNNVIKKHELTRPDKEDDRVRHIESLNAQTGPVFLTYRAVPELDDLFQRKIASPPDIDFTAKDGVRHSSWNLSDSGDISFIHNVFDRTGSLYIADGHHRSAAAARVYQARKGAGQSAQFLTVIFPHNQMQILPYNRVLKDLNGLTPEQLMQKLDGVFTIQSVAASRQSAANIGSNGGALPRRRSELGLFLGGQW